MKQKITNTTLFLVVLLGFSFPLHAQTGPGGVSSDLQLWYSADSGTSTTTNGATVTTWDNRLTTGSDLTAENTPTFVVNALNYNPGVRYETNARHKINTQTVESRNSTIYSVGIRSAGSSELWNTGLSSGGSHDVLVYIQGPDFISYYDEAPSRTLTSSLVWNADRAALLKAQFPDVANFDATYSLNAGTSATITAANTTSTDEKYLTLGNWHGNSFDEPFGDVLETIVYSSASVLPADEQKIQSYLALKYGIRLGAPHAGPNYIASNGTVFWNDAATTNAFSYNVFGIGRDDASGLHQRVSKSQEPSAILTAATSADFTSSNLDLGRTDLDTDLEFVTHAVSTDAALARTAVEVAPNYKIANKTWFIQETGDVAPVQYQVEVSNLALLSSERLYAVVATNMSGTPVIEYIPATVASNLATFEVDWPANTSDNRLLLAVYDASAELFLMTVKTDNPGISALNEFTIETEGSGYNYNVDCNNDGIYEATGVTGDYTCTYASAGTYQVAITDNVGDSTGFPRIFYSNASDEEKILSIDQWGTLKWTSMAGAFHGATNLVLEATDVPDLSSVTNFSLMFRENTNLVDNGGQINNWDMSTATDLQEMFFRASNFNEDISNWDVSNVTNMSLMFRDATLFNQPLNTWVTTSLQNMRELFFRASNFDQPLSNWDVSNVTNMRSTFREASLFNQDLSAWNTGMVINMFETFFNASVFNNLNQSMNTWDVRNVTNMGSMFRNASVFNSDINGWETNSVTDMSNMFFNATAFNGDISFKAGGGNQGGDAWNTMKVTTTASMFLSATNFNQDIGNWNMANNTDMSNMFNQASVFNHDIGSWNTTNVTSIYRMFRGAPFFNNGGSPSIGTWDLSGLDPLNDDALRETFDGAVRFNQDIGNWNVSNVTDFFNTFLNAVSFDQDLSNWNMSNVLSANGMLSNSGLSLSNYDKTLIGWNAQTLQSGVTLGAAGLQYCTADVERQNMITSDGWTIQDAGKSCKNFIMTVKTDNPGISGTTEFKIETNEGTVGYNYNVDCNNDGTYEATGVTGDYTCSYAAPGTYQVAITDNVGDDTGFPRFFYNDDSDEEKILSIDQWGSLKWETMGVAFFGASNLVLNATDTPDLTGVSSFDGMFRNNSSLVDNGGQINTWDMSSATDINSMFYGATVFNSDVSSWDVSNVTSMINTFRDADSFNQNIGAWNTENVERMNNMFFGAEAFNQDLNTWDVRKVTSMEYMFREALVFDGNITSWQTDALLNLSGMFFNAHAFDQDITYKVGGGNQGGNAWDVGLVTNFSLMFASYSGVGQFNQAIGNWNTSSAIDMSNMFVRHNSFNQPLNDWDVSNVTNFSGMFASAGVFDQPLDQWVTSSAENMSQMFGSNGSPNPIFNQDISSWDVSNVSNFAQMFRFNATFNQDISGWTTDAATDMSLMFIGASAFNQNLGNWTMSGVTNVTSMLNNSGLSVSNYDKTLIGWDAQALQPSLTLGALGLQYCVAETDRQNMITSDGWTIDDAGKSASCVVPGGVNSGLALWLKADVGISETAGAVSAWADQSSSSFDLTQSNAVSQPLWKGASELMNFNPVVDFDGLDDNLAYIPSSLIDVRDMTMFVVGEEEVRQDAYPITLRYNSTTDNIIVNQAFPGDNNVYWSYGSPFTPPQRQNALAPFSVGDAVIGQYRQDFTNNNKSYAIDGNQQQSGGGTLSSNGADQVTLGGITVTGSPRFYNGKIPEYILYTQALSLTETNKVESYLALKYGITLDQTTATAYLASDGSKMWDETVNTAYNNDIFGIGREDASALDQRVSTSQETDDILTAALDNNFTAANTDIATRNTAFNVDRSFLTFANDDAAITATTADLPDIPIFCGSERLAREWQAQLTNFDNATEPVSLQFNLSGSGLTASSAADFMLIIDIDGNGDFSNGTIEYVSATSFTSDLLVFEDVSQLENGAVFTVVSTAFTATAFLTSTTTTVVLEECIKDGSIRFINPANPNQYIGEILLNGNTIDPTDIQTTIEAGITPMANLGAAESVSTGQAIQLMDRLIQIDCPTCNLTVNGGVSVRLFWDPIEKDDAETTFDALLLANGITNNASKKFEWFKVPSTIADVKANISPAGIVSLSPGGQTWAAPSATGTIDAVDYVQFDNITSFSTFGGGWSINQNDGSLLPVEMLYFTANPVKNEYIQLDWATATEINNEGFEIQRSENGTDFETIGWVNGNGNTAEVMEYAFIDREVSAEVLYYYRLRQIDFDSNFEYSKIVNTALKQENNDLRFVAYPNPSSSSQMFSIDISTSTSESGVLTIYNMLGVEMFEQKINLNSGLNHFEIEALNLSSGQYFITINLPDRVKTKVLSIY